MSFFSSSIADGKQSKNVLRCVTVALGFHLWGGFDFEDGIENYHDSEVIVSTYFQPCNNVRMITNI